MNLLWFVGASILFSVLLASDAPRNLFFSGEDAFMEAFVFYFTNVPHTFKEYREVFLLKDKEYPLIDTDLFTFCVSVEESRYADVEVGVFLKYLQRNPCLSLEEKNTLTHPVCQRCLAASIPTLESPLEMARFFNRLTPEIVANSLILNAFWDYSRFEPSALFKEVVAQLISLNMLEIGSPELIHVIFEVRNYELDPVEIQFLLQNRPELFENPFFQNDPNIFAAMTVFSPIVPLKLDVLNCFLKAFRKQKEKKLSKTLIDLVVLFWIRSEAAINAHIGFLSIDFSAEFFDSNGIPIPKPSPEPAYQSIRKELEVRSQLISSLCRFDNTAELIDLLKTPLNLVLRSDEGHSLKKELGPLPYNSKLKSFEEIEAAFLKFKIKSKRWTFNFYTALIPFKDQTVPESILQAHKLLIAEVFPNPFDNLWKRQTEISAQVEKEQEDYKFMKVLAKASNALSSLYDRMNLTHPEFFTFLSEEGNESLKVLTSFAHLVLPETIRKWLETLEARQFLIKNPQLVFNLPTLMYFLPEDCHEFNIQLDSAEVVNIHSLSTATTQALLSENECIFNYSMNVIHRINPDCLIPQEHWSLVSLWAVVLDASLTRAESWISMLKITQVFNLLEMNDSQLLGLAAHWLVHMEWNSLWKLLIHEYPIFAATESKRESFFALWTFNESTERLALSETLKKKREACGDEKLQLHYDALIQSLAPSFSTCPFRISVLKSHNINLSK